MRYIGVDSVVHNLIKAIAISFSLIKRERDGRNLELSNLFGTNISIQTKGSRKNESTKNTVDRKA